MKPAGESVARRDVAIVGIGCRFPGGIDGPQDYWRLLMEGREAIGPIPTDRIDLARLAKSEASFVPPFGGYLDGIDRFDAAFFSMSPREAERLDPQQRLLLETAWEALEDAGQEVSRLAGARGGVFIGQWLSDFEGRLLSDPAQFDFFMTTGSGRYAASGRLSALFGWGGPSITVDTACSSSLVAVHLAARSLQAGDSEIALVGAANVILEPHISVGYARSGMLAADGRCKFGDASADGYVRSEGAAVLVLKLLEKAQQEGDRIYAVILGSAINNDGGGSGFLGTPKQSGQEALLRSALADAGLQPQDVSYVEAHGTGTKVGDPVEIGAIGAVLGQGRTTHDPLLIGSAKTNIGHTEASAGLAGLIKVALGVHEGFIPPSLHFRTPNPSIPWNDLGCRIVTEPTEWPQGRDRIASVNSLGISNTNAHVLVGVPPARRVKPSAHPAHRKPWILPLSARSPESLRALAGRYAGLLSQQDAPDLGDVCRSAALRRSPMALRAAFVAGDAATMAAALTRYAEGDPADAEGEPGDARIAPAFVAPGQGAQHAGMARALLASEPAFRAALERCDAAVRRHADWSIVDVLSRADEPEIAPLIERIDVIQPILVSLSIAYAELLRSVGVHPGALVGHSMGEIAAAYLAGVLDHETAMKIICRRSALMSAMSGKGAMALVELTLAEARLRIAPVSARVSVAAHNGPTSCVLSGDPEALATILQDLETEGVFFRLVKVDVASHSPQMEPAAGELTAELAGLEPGSATVPIYSTVTGRRAGDQEFAASYWGTNLTRPVLFFDAVDCIVRDGISTFVELGPHPVLLPSIQEAAGHATLASCGRREESDERAFAVLLATLWANGTELDWRAVFPGPDNFVRLPTYPWQRERHWYAGADMPFTGSAVARPAPLDGEQRSWLRQLEWRVLDAPSAVADLRGVHWIVTGTGSTADLIAAAIEDRGGVVRRAEVDNLGQLLTQDSRENRIIVVAGPRPDPFLPIRLLQQLAEVTRPLRTWIVTDGGQSTGNEPADVAAAALWGAARVAREERPEVNLVLVDMPTDDGSAASLFATRVLAGGQEDQMAVRDGRCLGLRLAPFETAPATLRGWRPDAAYLITGGLGDIGLMVAAAMVDQGARRLILMGRTPLPDRSTWLSRDHSPLVRRRINAVRALEAKGASIHLACVDVADEGELSGYLSAYAGQGWPPIAGAVHAAGSFANRLWPDMNAATFQAVLGPKLDGAILLDRLLPELDSFVLFSSTGAYVPQPGQANYAAANAGLEALAQQRRLRGQHATCLAWGPWEGTGLVSDASGRANVREMERQGFYAMPARPATALFSHLSAVQACTVIICRMDAAKYVSARSMRGTALFKELLEPEPSASELGGDELANDEPRARRARLEAVVRDAVGQVLKLSSNRLDARKTLGSMGLTSLMAMELRNRLEATLRRPLSATLAWNYPTITAIVDYLSRDAATNSEPVAVEPARERPTSALSLSAVDAMTEDDVLAALSAGRSRGGKR